MTNANISQNTNTKVLYEPLPKQEREKLNKIFGSLKHSKKMNAYKTIGASPDTVKKAMAGLDVTPVTAEKIRAFLESQNSLPNVTR